MVKKTTAQIREEIVATVMDQLKKGCPELFAEGAMVYHSGKKQFAIPMGTDDAPQACALISVTVPQWVDTSKAEAFDLAFAEEELAAREKEKAEKAAERERKKEENRKAAEARKAKREAERQKVREKIEAEKEEAAE